MPECRDCGRLLATCELRRLPSGGWRCKDAGRGSRCWTLALARRVAERRARARERGDGGQRRTEERT